MLKEYVIANVKPDEYYASRFPRWNPLIKGNITCAFHEDSKPSLAISLKNGGAHCHASTCGVSFGNIVHFESVLKEIPEKIAAKRLYAEFIRPIISPKLVDSYRQYLLTNTEYILKIKKDMGLNTSSILKFKLGVDPETHRITIPIYDQFNQCINIRFYRLPSLRNGHDDAKIYNYKKGFGRLDLFPIDLLLEFRADVPLYFMASEKEAMLAIQLGLAAFSTTTGEGSWSETWNPIIKDRIVYLIFDRDKGGKAAESRISKQIATVANVQLIKLPFSSSRPDWKDFADWILRDKGNVQVLRDIHEKVVIDKPKSASQTINPPSVYPELPDYYACSEGEIHDVSEISSNNNLLNSRVRCHGIVAAKASNTYSIPWKFKVKLKERPPFIYSLPMGRELLRLIKSSDTQILQSLQKILGSTTVEIDPLAYLTATEVEIIPTAAADKDIPYVVQRCYYFGNRIESNVPYQFDIIPTSEIRTQETIGIITNILPLSKSIDRFELTPSIQADLSVFQSDDNGVWSRLVSVANELATHHTRIYNRLDWHLVALLTWLCPIGFKFPGESELQRGWINSLALGDTETGKSKVAKKLQEIFKCGVFVNAENCTYVGLVGGAIKVGSGQLMLRWGRIPLSDKQLVILEELSGLSVEEIANMSDVRSSGVARLDKGGISAETNSRTRLLCLSNARSARKSLSNYLFGVHAIQELIGHGEDIARFDLITTLVDNEVSNELINTDRFATIAKTQEVEKTFATDQLNKLCHLIWSLTPQQINFTRSAYESCLEETKKLAAVYHSSIPIFKGGSGRYKLARIACAIACLQFSWNNSKGGIDIDDEHVKAAARLLRFIYNKHSFGYRDFSKAMYDREAVKDKGAVRKALVETISKTVLAKVLETLIHSTRFTRDELSAIGGITTLHSDRLIGVMIRERALRKGDLNMWEITPAGKTFFESLIERYDN